MHANSRPIETSQTQTHPRLREFVQRHLDIPFRRRPSAAGREAFASFVDRLREPFILDAGCGTGESTTTLARRFGGTVVLGVDKSDARLAKAMRLPDSPSNALLLRFDLVDFWQLAAAAGLRCKRQYVLYPNPWPKAEHLKRRWHAHPVFAGILALGGAIELRTNWRVYAEEFAAALRIAGRIVTCVQFSIEEPMTPFERKYAASGHTLWRCVSE